MDWWLILLLGGGFALLVLRACLGPGEPDDVGIAHGEEFVDQAYEPEPWEAEALARYGTETSIEQLIDEGCADELRGLGYRGELPER